MAQNVVFCLPEGYLGADHLIPGGWLWFFFCEKKYVQQKMKNKQFVQLLVEKNSLLMK